MLIMGIIRKTEKVNRAIDFSSLNRSAGMSKHSRFASDIDMVSEFSDTYLIMTELKEDGMDIATGQELMLTRIAKRWAGYGERIVTLHEAIVIFATHDPNHEGDVPVEECQVQRVYLGSEGKWFNKKGNLLDVLHAIGNKYNIDKLKKQ